MISGPTVPHPRLLLADLLRKKGGLDRLGGSDKHFLESGLVFLEEEVEFGEGLRVDFLARDSAGAPVLILVADDEDAADIPLVLLDLDLWFRENSFLLRQGLGLMESAPLGLRWDLQHRIFLVTHGMSANRLKRLEGLASLPLQVFELAFLALRGKRQWYARSIPLSQGSEQQQLPCVPTGLEDVNQTALVGLLLERLRSLSPAIEIHGDRYHRLVLFEGRPCVELLCTDREARLHIEGREDDYILLSVTDVEAALDQVLRLLLERQANDEGFTALGQAQDEDDSESIHDSLRGCDSEPETESVERLAQPLSKQPADEQTAIEQNRRGITAPVVGRLRAGAKPRQKLPEARDLGPKLTEEEIDAFLNS